MEAEKTENKVTLYDYFYIQFGMKPEEEFIEKFKKLPMASPRGKTAKRTIDAAVALMTTFDSQKLDSAVIQVVTNYLGGFVEKER